MQFTILASSCYQIVVDVISCTFLIEGSGCGQVLAGRLLTDFMAFEKIFNTFIERSVFLVGGAAWLTQVKFLMNEKMNYLFLSQWGFWFACSGLLFVGGQ
jgi:hypothetical protein